MLRTRMRASGSAIFKRAITSIPPRPGRFKSRMTRLGRFTNLDARFGGEQSPQPGSDDRVIVDDQYFHGSATANDRVRGLCAGAHGRVAVTWKPFSGWFEKVSRPPTALTRSRTPIRP